MTWSEKVALNKKDTLFFGGCLSKFNDNFIILGFGLN